MKTLKLNAIALIAFLTIGISSCSKDDNTTTQPTPQVTSIAAQAVANPNLSLLVKALTKAGLVQTLSDPGTYTVFAPTNTAFEAAGFTAAVIDAQTSPAQIDALKQVLLNHVLATRKASTELTTGYVKTLAKGAASTTNTLSMYVDATSGVKLNGGAVVTTPNLNASNGIIHVVDKVITLPTIVTHATANSNFSVLVAALTRTGNTTNFAEILGGTANSPFTVFAPVNDAFTKPVTGILAELNFANLAAIPEPALDKILKYHVIAGANVLATTLPSALTVQNTFLGQTFEIGTSGGAKIKDKAGRFSNIIATDVQCSNGVIHVLDKVLVPTL
jgi:uncharacterized surface protein with fasciclin (FAS1) repeats